MHFEIIGGLDDIEVHRKGARHPHARAFTEATRRQELAQAKSDCNCPPGERFDSTR